MRLLQSVIKPFKRLWLESRKQIIEMFWGALEVQNRRGWYYIQAGKYFSSFTWQYTDKIKLCISEWGDKFIEKKWQQQMDQVLFWCHIFRIILFGWSMGLIWWYSLDFLPGQATLNIYADGRIKLYKCKKAKFYLTIFFFFLLGFTEIWTGIVHCCN